MKSDAGGVFLQSEGAHFNWKWCPEYFSWYYLYVFGQECKFLLDTLWPNTIEP